MPTQFKTLEPVATKEKFLAFTEEALLITGIGVGSVIGGNIMVHDQISGMAAPGPLLHGGYAAIAIGLSVGKVLPIAINYAFNRSTLSKDRVGPMMEQLERAVEPHTHAWSRVAGLAAGIGMSITMAAALNLEPFDLRPAKLGETFLTASEPVVATTETSNVFEKPGYTYIYPASYGGGMSPGMWIPDFDQG